MSSSIHAQVEALRARIRPGSGPVPDFGDLMSSFLDLADNAAFIRDSQWLEAPDFHEAVEATASRFLGVQPALAQFALARWGDSDLIHGAFMTRTRHTGVAFWFQNDMVGLVSLTPPNLRGCDYFRLTAKVMPTASGGDAA